MQTTFVDLGATSGLVKSQSFVPFDRARCLLQDRDSQGHADPARQDCWAQQAVGGGAVGDYDDDGDPDVYLTGLGGPGSLYRNDGKGTFTDVTAAAGITGPKHSNGATFADLDNDGRLDLVVTTVADGRYYLFHGQPDGTFAEEAEARGTAVADGELRSGTTVAAGDYDRDGYLDLIIGEWIDSATLRTVNTSHARLLRNQGTANPGHFVDATTSAGVQLGKAGVVQALPYVRDVRPERDVAYSFGVGFADFDNDGWEDVFASSDYGTSQIFWNNQDGTFTEGTKAAGINRENNAMGSTVADFNNDGMLDWFVTAIYDQSNATGAGGGRPLSSSHNGNRLYLNNGNRTFSDATDAYGVRNGGWGWGTASADFDNNGRPDLFMTSQVLFPTDDRQTYVPEDRRTSSYLWWNVGATPLFESASQSGLTTENDGRGVMLLDPDGDGAIDILTSNNSGPPTYFRNNGPSANWLEVRARGTTSNTTGIGARIVAELPDGSRQTVEIGSTTNFLANSDHRAHFGLGSFTEADVTVSWPASGRTNHVGRVSTGTRTVVTEPAA